jgi:hypothetical protein
MRSTIGRPRLLTDEMVARILAWDDARRQLKSRKELALELRVSESVIGHAIARRGQYKLPPPDQREFQIAERRRLIACFEKEKNRKPKRVGRDCRVSRG